jgi:hypothetical protein
MISLTSSIPKFQNTMATTRRTAAEPKGGSTGARAAQPPVQIRSTFSSDHLLSPRPSRRRLTGTLTYPLPDPGFQALCRGPGPRLRERRPSRHWEGPPSSTGRALTPPISVGMPSPAAAPRRARRVVRDRRTPARGGARPAPARARRASGESPNNAAASGKGICGGNKSSQSGGENLSDIERTP